MKNERAKKGERKEWTKTKTKGRNKLKKKGKGEERMVERNK